MEVSSQDVIRSVSKKLKYYIDVKRLEDGFDLSGVDCPKLDHPPTKPRPTLQYDGLHDRPLKHYFSPKNVKQILTQFKAPLGRTAREKEIRQQLERYLRRHQFAGNGSRKEKSSSTQSLHTNPDHKRHRRGRPVGSAKSNVGGSQPSVLSDGLYTQTKHSKKLKPEASGGFGVGLKKRKSQYKGGQTPLRSVPSTSVGRNEADRLMNLASRLLATTEMIDVNKPPVKLHGKSGEEEKRRGAPRSFENHRGRHKIYTYDIHGRRLLIKPKPESEEDSAYNSPSPNYLTINGDQVDDQIMPNWLRGEVSRGEKADSSRPHSSYITPRPSAPEEEPRPYSALAHQQTSTRSSSDASTASIKPQPKNGWASDQTKQNKNQRPKHHKTSQGEGRSPHRTKSGRTESAIQTGGELLRHYEPSEQIIGDGERTEYEVHVTTGSGLGASTKADVKISLIGDKGRTKEIYLEDSSTHKIKFQKGQEDIFKLDTFYVGTLRKIAIGHDRQELGFGWYLSKVIVRDLNHLVQYVFPCERWLSARESDQRTFREFPVDYSCTFNPAPKEPARDPSPTPRLESSDTPTPAEDAGSDVTSHTSLATVYSDRSDRSGSGRTTPTRRGRAKSRQSSSTSTYTSSSSYYSSDEESLAKVSEKEEPKPKPPPERRQIRRRDTFFDQKPVGPDYGSVIDSISHTTEQDLGDRHADFPDKKDSAYVARNPVGKELVLKDDDEETGVLNPEDVADPEADKEEEEKVGTRLSMPDPPDPPKATKDLDDLKENTTDKAIFKAARARAQGRQEVAVSSSDSDASFESSDSESDLESGLTIHEVAKRGNLELMKKTLQRFPDKKNETDERGWTPIHIVASAGHTELVKWLAVSNADLNVETPTSYTAIHIAAMHGHTNTMMVLYAMGASLTSKTVDHQMPIHVAAMGGHLESVKWLVASRVPINVADNLGRSPFDLAEEYHHEKVAAFLKSCQEEQARPGTSLSLIRSSSKQSHEDKNSSHPEDSSSSDSNDDSEPPVWENNMRPTTPHQSMTEDSQSRKSTKHDEELMEKKQLYEEQQRRLSEKNVSFLDDIRNQAL